MTNLWDLEDPDEDSDGNQIDVCPECGNKDLMLDRTGSEHHSNGEVWDDVEETLYCPNCGWTDADGSDDKSDWEEEV